MSAATSPATQCTLCGRCLEVCPLLAATGREELSPRAKHFLVEHLISHTTGDAGALKARPAVELARLCLSCGRCAEVCPVGLSGAEAVAELRAAHPDFQQWLWRAWVEQGGLLWPSLAALGRLVPDGLAQGEGRIASMAGMLGAMDERKALEPWLTITPARNDTAEPLVLFSGCTASRVLKSWKNTAQDILERVAPGALAEPAWSCCGATLGHAGAREAQLRARKKNVQIWRDLGRPGLVTYCASCRAGLVAYADDPALGLSEDEAHVWREVLPLGGLLADADFELDEARVPERVLYHRPCHETGDADAVFLSRALGERLVADPKNPCCGMGGVLQLGAPELSGRVARANWDARGAQPGDVMLSGCSGCVLQLKGTAPAGVHVGHWLEIVRLA